MLPIKRKKFLLPTVSGFFEDDWNSLVDLNNGNNMRSEITMPSVNVKENDDEFILEIASPGLKKEDFHIEINNALLTVKSEVKKRNNENDIYVSKEFSFKSFQRSFSLNHDILDSSNISAEYQDGILSIVIPKKEEAKPKPIQKIKIS